MDIRKKAVISFIAFAASCCMVGFLWNYSASASNVAVEKFLADYEKLAREIIFAVPLICAVSIALFNNVFKIHDRIEQIYRAHLENKAPLTGPEIDELFAGADAISNEIISNAKYSIVFSITIYVLLLFRKLIGMDSTVALRMSFAIEGLSLGFLVTIPALLMDTFSVLPDFISVYRLLTMKLMQASEQKILDSANGK